MKKKLFTLLLCAFAAIGANAAAYIGDGGTTLYINGSSEATFEDITALQGYDASTTITKIVVKGDCTSGWTQGWLINAGTSANTAVKTIDMSEAQMGGNWKFHAFNNLEEIIWPDPEKGGSLTAIPQYAFDQCSIKSITIPKTVKELGAHSFELNGLETVIIPEDAELEIIRKEAFNNCTSIKDVYVNVRKHQGSGASESDFGGTITYYPWCEEQAFPYAILVDQTAVGGGMMATLHFPDDDFDFYCGTWKEGMVFTQSNLNTIKDGNGTVGPTNGWQQFAKTGSPREVLVIGKLLRTFSDEENLVAPTGIHVYRATAYTEASTGGTLTLTEITYKKGSAQTDTKFGIPGSTGVILKSGSDYVLENGATESKFYLSNPDENDTFNYYPWQEESGHNWLVPTLLGGDEITSADWSNGEVKFRNFGFKKTSDDDGVFIRLKKGKLAASKAYLKLPADITKSLAEVNEGPGLDIPAGSSAKVAIVFEDADLSQTTSLQNVDEIVKNALDNNYYTLEGVKVTAPLTKGIYVHNGKKVVIK